jgi:hypothetical protein
MRWTQYTAHIRKIRNSYKILVGKSEGKRLFRRPRHRCKDNIRLDLSEIGWKGVDWTHLAQDKD